MQPKTKEIICQNLLVEILAHEIDGKSVTLKFKSKRKEYTFVTVEDSALMIELIHGYKEFHRIRKREKVGGQNFAPSSSPEGLSYLSVKNPIWKSDSFTSKKSMNYPSMMNKLVVKS